VRPTSDRVREALFNILGDMAGASVLDVCAGTGAIALEALSRGAAKATVIERDKQALRAIHANVASLGAELEISGVDLRSALPQLIGRGATFDLVFTDPPWAEVPKIAPVVLEAARTLLTPEGTVVVEHASRSPAPQAPAGLELDRTRTYGDTALSFYRRAMKEANREPASGEPTIVPGRAAIVEAAS